MINQMKSPQKVYLWLISLLGLILLGYSIFEIFSIPSVSFFFLFMGLAITAQVAATSVNIKTKTAITFAVSPPVSLAAAAIFGPAAAVIIEAISAFALWMIKPADVVEWKRSWPQLFFNTGMSVLSIFISALVLLGSRQLIQSNGGAGIIIPWLVAGIVNDQVNLGLIAGMLRLQFGHEFSLTGMWLENAWAIPISIFLTSIGGGFLEFAFTQFGWTGLAVFFIPIILSSYAFRLYVNQMQAHMDNLEHIVAERTAELKIVMQEKDAFLAVLTHDMKSPLTTIGIYSELLKKRPQLLLERPEMTDNIQRSQERLSNIVNNILDLEKIQAQEGLKLEKENFSLITSIDGVVQTLAIQASEKNIELQFQADVMDQEIFADRDQFERIIQNLISNAIKYTGSEGQVMVSAHVGEENIQIVVQDNGYGIPADEIPYIFDRFRRVTKHEKKAVGTGLGLAITKALVEAHGGEITVYSKEDQGSKFSFWLPIQT